MPSTNFFLQPARSAHFATFPLAQSSRPHDEGPLSLSQAGKRAQSSLLSQASGGTHLLHYRAPVMELIRLNRRELVVYPFALTLACSLWSWLGGAHPSWLSQWRMIREYSP